MVEENTLKQRLQDQIDASRRTLEKAQAGGSTINEAQTEHYLIDPLLVALGYELWEITKQGHDTVSQDTPDYTLLPGTSHKWFLEAKKISHQLQDKDALQAFKYPFSQGTEWGVLTNGRTWHIYNAHFPKPLTEKRVMQIDDVFSDPDAVEKLALLSRQSMQKNGLTQAWIYQRVINNVKSQLETPNSVVRKQLRKIISAETGASVDETTIGKAIASLSMIGSAVAAKANLSAPALGGKNGAEVETVVPPSLAPGKAVFYTFTEIAKDVSLATFRKPKMLLFEDGHERTIKTWADAAKHVVEYVGQTYPLPQLPFNTSQKGKKCFLNTSDEHGNGSMMLSHRIAQVGPDKIYIDTNRSTSDIAGSLSAFLISVGAPPAIVKVTIV